MGNESSKNQTQTKASQEWKSFLECSRQNFQNGQVKPVPETVLPVSSKLTIACEGKPWSLADFEFYCELGAGAFAEVYLALCKRSRNQRIALKVLDKNRIIAKGQEEHVNNERKLLSLMQLPFIIGMHLSFQTKASVCLGLEYVPGGELFILLRQKRTFTEEQSIFFASQVILALEYLHNLDIVYRDLKPENILLDQAGYLKVADFGFAKVVPKRTYTVCGTPEYIAPEILAYKGYGKAVDWWALGILIYEMLHGQSAFYANDDVVETYNRIMEAKVRFVREINISRGARHLIKHLLERDLSKRFGILHAGVVDIRGHAWFQGLDWVAIFNKTAPAPFRVNCTAPAKGDKSKLMDKLLGRENSSAESLSPQEFAQFG